VNLFVEIDGRTYGIDGRLFGKSIDNCQIVDYLKQLRIEDEKPFDLNVNQYNGKYYLQKGSLIKSNKKCGCLDQTGSDKPGASVYYRNYLDIGEDIATSIATTEANPEEVCRDPEEPGEGDLKCGGITNILVTDINCSNYGSTIPCTSCNKRCDHCSDPYNPCPGCETWSSVGSQTCYNSCVDCCPYPELGCVPSLKIFNNYDEVLSYFSQDSCDIGDNQKEACANSLEFRDGSWGCYDLTTQCGPGVEVNFTASAADDYTRAEYDGIVLSYGGSIQPLSNIGEGGSRTFFVVPGGTAKIIYGNYFTSCGYLGSASISSRGNTVQLNQPYRCGNGTAGCGGIGSSPCPAAAYELTVLTLNIPILP